MSASRRVLIVEDEDILAENLQAYLQRASCDARVAPDGASAIRALDGFVPDVLVLDYRLPDMSGFQVLDAIRMRGATANAILMTGQPRNEVYDEAVRRGIEHILFKPFPLAELSKVVRCIGPYVATPVGGGAEPYGDGQGLTHPDRRLHASNRFPMRLYDGTWLFADRRHAGRFRPLREGEGEGEE
ncbi:response regulator [Aromatoleum toluclasticum]|uniref:response regulator n=1 Tax=Aromatoleum toluclasticum TaxID=92003 RepID=UPI00039FCD4B|nr:response regulator [Aromatoleum toluclasticum]